MLACREGEELGPYQVLQVLGRGSFGVVLLAVDPRNTSHHLALKLVPCDHLDVDAASRARTAALGEAELLRRLRHPHIVTCHDVRWDSDRRVVWFALDFMDGGDLQSLVEHKRRSGEGPPEATFVRRVITAIGSALRYIHGQQVLHRDVKPSNVLLSRESSPGVGGDIKLADFGISKLLEVTTQAYTIVGTPSYMSPELVRGEPYGTASDNWAFGVLLYELATLRRPFEAGNQLALVRHIVDEAPAPLPSSLPVDISRTINGLLEKDPQQRLQLAEALALSPTVRGMVPLPPPSTFPQPTSPGGGLSASGSSGSGIRFGYVAPKLNQEDITTEPHLHQSWSANDLHSSVFRMEVTSPVTSDAPARACSEWSTHTALASEELPSPTWVTTRSQAVASGLSPRPGLAFSDPEESQKSIKQKQREKRRWLPRFGIGLRSGGNVSSASAAAAAAAANDTAILAFDSELSEDSDLGAMSHGANHQLPDGLGVPANSSGATADLGLEDVDLGIQGSQAESSADGSYRGTSSDPSFSYGHHPGHVSGSWNWGSYQGVFLHGVRSHQTSPRGHST